MYKMKMCKFVFYNSFIWDYFYPSFPILFSSLKRIDWEIEVEGKIVEYIYIYIYIYREREREGKLGYSLCFERFHRCNTRNGRKLDQMVLGKLSSLVNIVIVGTG